MSNKIIVKLALGANVTDKDLREELHQICEDTHACCDSGCPVYEVNGHEVPDTVHDFQKNRGCDCFKDGAAMLKFIREH